jgi:transposase
MIMVKPRKFSPEFKTKIALAAVRGESTIAELCRKHQLSDTLVARWKTQLLKQAHQVFSSTTPDDAQQERIDERERMVGRLTVELDAVKKLSVLPR